MTLNDAKSIVDSICDGLLIQANDLASQDLNLISIDLKDRAAYSSNAKELIVAIEIAEADLEYRGGLDETISSLRWVAKEIAS